MTKKAQRPRTTARLSVSVDPETMRALRVLADEEFEGSLSALITDFADDARRRHAAGEYLREHGIPKLAEPEASQLEAAIDLEVATARRKSRSS